MITSEEITDIGKFQRTHALKGELNAMFDIDPALLEDSDFPLIVEFDGIYVPFYCESVRPKGHFSFLVKLNDIDSEDEARPFVNKTVYGLKSLVREAMEEEEGEYASDLVGYKLIDRTAGEVGEIIDVDLSTDNALFIIEGPDGTVYVPVTEDFIEEVNPEERTISVDLPEGLLDINKK